MIDRRIPGFVLLLLAGALYGGFAVPARRAAALSDAELARVLSDTEPLRRRVAEGDPQRAALLAWREAGLRGDQAPTTLRQRLLQSAAGAPVTGVRLSVRAANAPWAAHAHFAALGSFPALVELSERLIGPQTGVVPERLHWARTGSNLSFELDGAVLSRAP